MSLLADTPRAAWEYFKTDDPREFRHHYADTTIDRERQPAPTPSSKLAQLWDVFAWYPSYYSPYERRFLLKVDASVLIFTALSFYTKYLDSSNVSNAYVSGMKEELNLNGNEFNYFGTFFNIGYCVFQLPLILLIQKQQFARYLLIVCELCWGLFTFAASTAQNANQLYVVRLFVGVSEAVSFPGSYVIMSTWYTPPELIRRAGFYNLMASVGTMTSGLLQTACREHLDGIMGNSGWRWQFIIDGVITLGCAIWGLLFFPGTPETTKKFGFFTEDDLVFARKRMHGKVALPTKFNKQTIKNIFTSWQIYILIPLWLAHHQAHYGSDLALYIKSRVADYGPNAPTNMAAAAAGVSTVAAFLCTNLSAVYGKLPVVTFALLSGYFSNACLAMWNVPEGLKIFSYYLENVLLSGLAPMFYAWAATLCRDSAEKKQITLALMNTVSYATQAWAVPLQWNTKHSPRFSIGFRINLIMILIMNLAFVAASILEACNDHIISKIAGQQKHGYRLLSSKDNSHSTLYEEEEVPPCRGRSVFGSQDLKTYGAIGDVPK